MLKENVYFQYTSGRIYKGKDIIKYVSWNVSHHVFETHKLGASHPSYVFSHHVDETHKLNANSHIPLETHKLNA